MHAFFFFSATIYSLNLQSQDNRVEYESSITQNEHLKPLLHLNQCQSIFQKQTFIRLSFMLKRDLFDVKTGFTICYIHFMEFK